MDTIIDNLIFRSSSVGGLCGKSGLGVTGEKLAIQTYLEVRYGRRKEFTSKYTQKGILCEEQAIKTLSVLNNKNYIKNDIRLSNEFITGECDIDSESEDLIIDVKNNWDIFTFNESKVGKNLNYEIQGQCYMELYNRNDFQLVNMLEDAPDSIILNALEKESYKYNGETPEWIEVEIIKSMVYDKANFERFINLRGLGGDELTDKCIDRFIEVPQSERINIKYYERNAVQYEFIVSRIREARNFLKKHFK